VTRRKQPRTIHLTQWAVKNDIPLAPKSADEWDDFFADAYGPDPEQVEADEKTGGRILWGAVAVAAAAGWFIRKGFVR
jgi:hypothetical protein